MSSVSTDRKANLHSIILSLASFVRRILWMSIGVLVVSPAYVRAKLRRRPTRRHGE